MPRVPHCEGQPATSRMSREAPDHPCHMADIGVGAAVEVVCEVEGQTLAMMRPTSAVRRGSARAAAAKTVSWVTGAALRGPWG